MNPYSSSPSSRRLGTRRSNTFKARRRMYGFFGRLAIPASLIALIIIISRLSYLGFFAITSVNVIGADPDLSSSVRAAAFEAIKGDYVRLFPRSNVLLYPKKAVASAVLSASPRIEDVSVGRVGLNALALTVTEKTPAALICANLPDWTDQTPDYVTNCYIADDKGFVFEHATTSSSTPSYASLHRYFMPDLDVQSSTTSQGFLGIQAMPEKAFSGLEKLYDGVIGGKIVTEGILIGGHGDDELYVRNEPSPSSDIAVIHFDGAKDPRMTLADFIPFWNHMKSEAGTGRVPKRFSDVKLQFSPNIYYTEIQ